MPENNVFSLDDDLALLSTVAKEAGQIALSFFGRTPKVWMKNGDRSPVSEADFAVDTYLKQTLLAARPDYGWISEESADERPARPYHRSFVVDPIDGTRGFLEGASQWCISLAIIEAGQPICGVLECPILEEHYSAHSGRDATLNGTILTPPVRQETSKIRLSFASSLIYKFPPHLVQKLQFAPSIPSLAYRLALLAKAGLDVVLVRPNSHDWDVAGADIVLRQSGILLTDLQNQPVCYGNTPFRHHILIAGHENHKKEIIPFL